MTNTSFKKKEELKKKIESRHRYETHVHSRLSSMEGISDLEEYIDDAEKKDIHGIAITDTNSTQAILEMNETLRQKIGKTNIRIVFGTEITIIDRKQTNAVIFGEREEKDKNKREKKLISEQEFIAIDIETTGLAVSSDKIIEFGYCIFSEELENKKKKINFKIKKSGSFLIHHPELIENKARHINRITYSELLSKGITHQEALQKINELLKDRVVVVFNQNFDLTFLQRDNLILGSKFPSSPVIDLMVLANIILKRRISLKSVSKTLLKKVFEEEKHHRAQYDAELLPKIFEKLLQRLILISKKEIRNLEQIKKESHKISASNPNLKLPRDQKYQVILLSKNKKGISEINKVLSQCNFNRIKYKIAALTEEELQVICETNPNFLIGSSACSEKMLDLVEAFKNNPNNKQNRFILKQKIALFDFLEVAPPSNTRWNFFSSKNMREKRIQEDLIEKFILLCKKKNKLIVATNRTRYTNFNLYNHLGLQILLEAFAPSRISLLHPLFKRKDNQPRETFSPSAQELPNLKLKSGAELTADFNFLKNKKLINEIVYENGRKIFAQITLTNKELINQTKTEKILSIRSSTHKLFFRIFLSLNQLYSPNHSGTKLLLTRVKKEWKKITKFDQTDIMLCSEIFCKQLREANIRISSRGSVGSSLIAWLLKITEINPFIPHYYCNNCKCLTPASKFNLFPENGLDLPPKRCRHCQKELISDGHNIEVEIFAGYEKARALDIDINVDADFHRQSQKLLATTWRSIRSKESAIAIKSGTIITLGKSLAERFVNNFFAKEHKPVNKDDDKLFEKIKKAIIKKITGIKWADGQHPGGILLLDKEDLFRITPLNYIQTQKKKVEINAMRNYNSIDQIKKIDVLGHNNPKIIRMMEEKTGIDSNKISFSDKETYKLFSDSKTIGIPEFGTLPTRRVTSLISKNQKKKFSFGDLVRISGLTHGRNIIFKSRGKLTAQFKAYQEKKISFQQLIASRDQIVTELIKKNIEEKIAIETADSVKSGFGIPKKYEKEIIQKTEKWFSNTCRDIGYLFPKSHSTAYVVTAWKIAWFKTHYPEIFYSVFLSSISSPDTLVKNPEIPNLLETLTDQLKLENKWNPIARRSQKNKEKIVFYQTLIEMVNKKIYPLSPNIEFSHYAQYLPRKIGDSYYISFPLAAVEGIGMITAKSIYQEQKTNGRFINISDLKERTKINKANLENLAKTGTLHTYWWNAKKLLPY